MTRASRASEKSWKSPQLGDAGVVDQDVEPPEPRQRRLHDRLGRRRIGDVGRDPRGAGMRRQQPLQPRRLDPSGHHAGRAGLGEQRRDRQPDAAIAAGDQRHLAVQPECVQSHAVPPLTDAATLAAAAPACMTQSTGYKGCHEDRNLQHQRHQGPGRGTAALAGRGAARCRRAAGNQDASTTRSRTSCSRTAAATSPSTGKKASTASPSLSKLPLEDVTLGLPGDAADEHARWIEATVIGTRAVRVCCLYLPNGNPAPGPKYDYKLAWMARLRTARRDLLATEMPAVTAGRLQHHSAGRGRAPSRGLGHRCAGACPKAAPPIAGS